MKTIPVPAPTSEVATKKMRANRRVDTTPEVKLRSALHQSGLRFRKDYSIRLINGRTVRPDIVFPRKKVAVFVDGCFWHSCPEHGSIPKSNRDYWIRKFSQNRERDQSMTAGLIATGWQVLRVWEHTKPVEAARHILEMLAL